MLRQQVDPKTVTLILVVVLAGVIYAYWKLLVAQPPVGAEGPRPGGGAGISGPALVSGFSSVVVETVAGGTPGFRDGAATVAQFDGPNALAMGPDRRLFIADSRNHRIRAWSPGQPVVTVAGGGPPGPAGAGRADGPADQARFAYPSGVAVAPDGALYIADTGNHRICVLRDGVVTTLAGGRAGAEDGVGSAARFRLPGPLSWGEDGTLRVFDLGNGTLRAVTREGRVTTLGPWPRHLRVGAGPVTPEPDRSLVYLAGQNGAGPLAPTTHSVSQFTATVALPGGIVVFVDGPQHALGALRPDGSPVLLAGILAEGLRTPGIRDGGGHRANFALPCAIAAADARTLYVADYESGAIRRVILPEWLLRGEEPPTLRFRPRSRFRSEGRGFGGR